MKRQLLFITLLFVIAMTGRAQSSDYSPMLMDGKMWKTAFFETGKDGFKESYTSYRIDGTETVDDMECFRLYAMETETMNGEGEYKLKYLIQEKDQQVFIRQGDEWILEFDFGLKVGDEFRDGWVVKSIAAMPVGGNGVFRSFIFSGTSDSWLEGVGSSQYGPLSSIDKTVSEGAKYESFCYYAAEKEKVLFDMGYLVDYMRIKVTNGVETVKTDNDHSAMHAFDLQGRRLAAPPAKGLFIQDGRKVVRK